MSRSDLVNHPMVTGAGPQENGWMTGPSANTPRFGDSELAELNRQMFNANRLRPREPQAGDIYRVGADPALPEPHSPAWAYVLVTLIIGLITGAVIAWLRR